MKADARRIAEAVAAWPENCRLVLLYGPDTAASADHATRLQRQFADPANPAAVTLLTGAQIAADPQALAAAAAELSMFGDTTIVRVDGATEDALEAIKAVLDGPAGNPAIIVAGALKKGPLLTLAEAHREVLALISYEPSARDAVALVGGIATEAGLRPTQAAARAIFDAANGDRATIRQEIEKLALYLDPVAAGGTRPVEMADVTAVGAGAGDGDWDGLVGAVASGDGAAVAALLPRLDAKGEAGIGALEVTAVALTHTHVDHLSGLVDQDGGFAFPNAARVYVATEELAEFRAEPRMIPVLSRLMPLEQGDGPMQGVTAINAPGHSPGHMAFLVEGRMLIWGDLVHHAAVQFTRPEVTWAFDSDPVQARASRQALMEQAVEAGWLVAGAHLPGHGIGRIERAGEAYAFHPVSRGY